MKIAAGISAAQLFIVAIVAATPKVKLTARIGSWFQSLGVAVVVVATASLTGSGPMLLQAVLPPKYAPHVLYLAAIFQAVVSRKAFRVHPDTGEILDRRKAS